MWAFTGWHTQTQDYHWLQVAGILGGSAELTGRALDSDCLVEPVRGPLIPGFAAVKEAARAAGAALVADHFRDIRPSCIPSRLHRETWACRTGFCVVCQESGLPGA